MGDKGEIVRGEGEQLVRTHRLTMDQRKALAMMARCRTPSMGLRISGAAIDRPKTSSGKRAPQECPCGFFNDARHECVCSPVQISRYLAKISGPLLDRIDLQIEVPALSAEEITSSAPGEPSSSICERVETARQIQRDRFRRSGAQCNAEMSSRQLRRWCELDPSSRRLIEQAIARLGLSARAYDRGSRLPAPSPTSPGPSVSTARTSPRRCTIGHWIGVLPKRHTMTS